MKVKEFCKKYGVLHPVVYEASITTPTRMKDYKNTDVPEEELIEAVSEVMKRRIEYYGAMVESAREILERMRGRNDSLGE